MSPEQTPVTAAAKMPEAKGEPEGPLPDVELLTWSAAIMPAHERSPRWYLVAGSIFLLFIAGSILRGAWSFAVVLLLLGGVYYLVHRRPPPTRTINIRTKGVVFDGEVMPWADCAGFWFLQGPDYTELHIERPNRRDIVIQTGPYSVQDLRPILQALLPELTGRRERLLDKLIRISKL